MQNRISNAMQSSQFLENLQRSAQRQAELQRQMSTGQRIANAYDDPVAARKVMDIDSQLGDIEQYQRRIGDATGMLAMRDEALASVSDTLRSVRDRVVQAAHGGTLTQSDRQAIAAELTHLKETVRDAANTQFAGEYIFAGTATGTAPYAAGSNLYGGSWSTMSMRVGPGLTVDTTIAADGVFGVDGSNVLDTIDRAINDLNSGSPTGMEDLGNSVLAAVDAHLSDIGTQQAMVGAAQNRIETIASQLDSMKQRLSETRSGIADVDMAQAYIDYQTQNTLYQSALAAGSRIMKTSLLDFL